MFKLIRHSSDDLEVKTDKESVRGNRVEIVTLMERMDVAPREIANAIASLEMNKHHFADFGVNRMFIYSGVYKN